MTIRRLQPETRAAKPASATVQAPLANPEWRVEITGIAALP